MGIIKNSFFQFSLLFVEFLKTVMDRFHTSVYSYCLTSDGGHVELIFTVVRDTRKYFFALYTLIYIQT